MCEIDGQLSAFPPDLRALERTENLARLFLAFNAAMYVLRTSSSLQRVPPRLVAAAPVAILVYMASLPVVNLIFESFPVQFRTQSVLAAAGMKSESSRRVPARDTLDLIRDRWENADASRLDELWRDLLADEVPRKTAQRRAELVGAYAQVGLKTRSLWERSETNRRSGYRWVPWRNSVQMQHDLAKERSEMRRYCGTNLVPHGAGTLSPCDFPLWMPERDFIRAVEAKQRELIRNAKCNVQTCPLLSKEALRDSTKAIVLPHVAYIGSRALLAINLLILLIVALKAGLPGIRSALQRRLDLLAFVLAEFRVPLSGLPAATGPLTTANSLTRDPEAVFMVCIRQFSTGRRFDLSRLAAGDQSGAQQTVPA
jgi:hypothetical protein